MRLSKHVGYKNAGTLEFLVDADENYYFIEMNPRIQVEHTVSEEVTGIDIVQAQILIEEGYPLSAPEIGISSQEDVHCNGYSVQLRITTEDPANNFMPDTGKINVYRSPAGNGIRLDGGTAHTGAEVTPYYDSLLVKIIAHDRTFKGVTNKAIRAIKETRIRGVKTNIPFLINVLQSETWSDVAQHRPLLRLGGHALYTLHIRQIADIAVFQNFFVCYRHAVNNTIKFRQRNADGNLHGVHAFKAVLPFLKGRNCRIGSQNRYVKLFQIIKVNRTAGSHGKLHDIQQHIDCRHTVRIAEEAVENLRQTGHAHLLHRHAVAENADSVDALCFQLFYYRSLVGQIAPHPFVAIKKNTGCRTAADAKITLVFR